MDGLAMAGAARRIDRDGVIVSAIRAERRLVGMVLDIACHTPRYHCCVRLAKKTFDRVGMSISVRSLHLLMPSHPLLRKMAEMMMAAPVDRATLSVWEIRVEDVAARDQS